MQGVLSPVEYNGIWTVWKTWFLPQQIYHVINKRERVLQTRQAVARTSCGSTSVFAIRKETKRTYLQGLCLNTGFFCWGLDYQTEAKWSAGGIPSSKASTRDTESRHWDQNSFYSQREFTSPASVAFGFSPALMGPDPWWGSPQELFAVSTVATVTCLLHHHGQMVNTSIISGSSGPSSAYMPSLWDKGSPGPRGGPPIYHHF